MNTSDAITVIRRLVTRHGDTVPRYAIGQTELHAVRRAVRAGLATIDRQAMTLTPAGAAALDALAAAVAPAAARFAATITANVDAFIGDRITHATFADVQKATWDDIIAAGPDVHDAVCAMLRATTVPALVAVVS